ncbi:MAG TPA: secretin N-terminal domain-containing protein [Opitutaceae bacterium]|nr:secretin N-terminal domain-containing protein [Opitutaceae bacterium]
MKPRPARVRLVLGFLAAAPGLTAQVPLPNAPRPPPGVVAAVASKTNENVVDSFKLSDGDIDAVLGALEIYTGRTIVRPGQLPTATYTLKITRPIPKAELVTALETILALNGVAVSPMGDRFLKVTALSQAKSEAPEMITGSSLDLPPSGRIVTKLFELNFLRVSEFVPQVQSFMTPGIGGGIVQLEKSNVVLVTDSLENIQKIERLLGEVDKPRQSALVPKFYQLHNAKASDVVTKIHLMFTGPTGNQLRATTTFTPDDRTGQVVVIADPREYPLFDSLIGRLDMNADPNTRNEVIYLKHADAKDVSTLLSQLISGQNSAAQKAGSQVVKPGQPANQPVGAVPAAAGAAPAAAVAETYFGGATEFSNFVTIQPDERTNSVVVSGLVDDIRLIKAIVEKIDILLAQVRIEVVIAEVVLSDKANSGISSATLSVGPAPNGGTSITNLTASLAGLGLSPAAATAANSVNPVNLIASLTSLGDISRSKILQQSTIVTTHNKEAMITVTDQLPVITGSTSEPIATGTASAPSFAQSSTVTYKDIGITLKVTPLIGDDGSVQLKIDQIVDDQGPSVTIDGNAQPSINHREATSFVNVMNDEMIVLGGFQSATKSIDRQKLGILFEIPVISNLLGYRDNEAQRSELLLFLRPHILRPDEGTADTHRAIQGMTNKDQLNKFLSDPSRLPDAQMKLKERIE